MSKKKKTPVNVNINAIQEILMDDIHRLRSGDTTPANINATCNAVGKILGAVKLQMEYARLTGQTPSIDLLALPSPEVIDQEVDA